LKKFFIFGIFFLIFVSSVLLPSTFAQFQQGPNPNLFVSAENSQFENRMSGPQVIEVIVIDSDINDTDEAKGEPDVTVSGKILRMVQAVDGNWYGYFADNTLANIADSLSQSPGTSLDFGTLCPTSSAGISVGNSTTFFSDANAVAINTSCGSQSSYNATTMNVIREAKQANDNGLPDVPIGQIDLISTDSWPFIQLYNFTQTQNVVIQYNKGGNAQTTTLNFDIVNNFAALELDRFSYGPSSDVQVTITDSWLNIDPTDEDSWTFGTFGNFSTNYQVFDENGNSAGDGTSNGVVDISLSLPDLMCGNGCILKINPNPQSSAFVLTLQDNADSILVPLDGNNDTIADPQNFVDWGTGNGNLIGNAPVTMTEQGPNSGVFGSYDEADTSNLVVTDIADLGNSASIDYNNTPTVLLVGFNTGSIDIQPNDQEWDSGEEIQVLLFDEDLNLNSRADEDLDLFKTKFVSIPSLTTGDPFTLAENNNTNGALLSASYGTLSTSNNHTTFTQDAVATMNVDMFSKRGIISSPPGISDTLIIDLDATAGDLQSSINDSTESFSGFNYFNHDVRSFGSNVVDVSILHSSVNPLSDTVGIDNGANTTSILLGTAFSPQSFIRLPIDIETALNDIPSSHNLALMFEFDSINSIGAKEAIVADFFSYGFLNEGINSNERIANQIIRIEVEETGDNTSTFEGLLQYVMVNQLNVLDPTTYDVLRTIADDPIFVLLEEQNNENAPRVYYLDVILEGDLSPIFDSEDTFSHTGSVSFERGFYGIGDSAVLILNDKDLNVNSNLIDIFTVVNPNFAPDPAVESVGSRNLPEFSFGPLGKMMYITIDGEIWASRTLDLDEIPGPDCVDNPSVTFDGLASTNFVLVETDQSSGSFIGDLTVPNSYCSRLSGGVNLPINGTILGATYVDFRDAQGVIREVSSPPVALREESIDNTITIRLGASGTDCQNSNTCLSPSSLRILPGEEVFWFNTDVATHTIVSGNPTDGPDGLFNSGFLSPGNFFSFVFNSPGTFDFYDIIHPWVVGEIVVADLTVPNEADVVIGLNAHNSTCVNSDSCYQPENLSIGVGTEVLWFNADIEDHRITSGKPNLGPDGEFASSILQPGQNFTHTFSVTGTFPYYDPLHPWAIGEIKVNPIFPPGIDVLITEGSSVPGCETTDDCFVPTNLVGNVGDTITWLNDDNAGHTVTSGTPGGGPDGLFDSGLMSPGGQFSHQFSKEGSFSYYDTLHPWMTGTVTINSEPCQVPSNGDWTINDNCELTESKVVDASVRVQNNSVLTIPSGVTLTIPSGENIVIESGSGVLIKSGGSLNILS
jgi:plastocyanin